MPVYVCVVRRAQCVICTNTWDLQPEEHPDRCLHCGSADWEWGRESADSRLIRQGISRLRRRLNPGAKSKKRQDRAKAQHQAMQPKMEAVEPPKRKNLSRPNRGRQ